MYRLSFLVIVLTIIGCNKVRLDGLAFPSEQLDQYDFEAAVGEIEIADSMLADPANYTLLSFNSHSEENNEDYTIYGLFIGDTASISTDTLIVYFHGQAKHMDYYFTRASLLANVGGKYNYNVLMMDYRGYGMSEGQSSELGLYEDADAIIDWLKSKNVDQQKTFFYGYSLGAIPAIDRIANRTDFQPRKLILESPLASVANLVENSTILQVDPDYVTDLKFENAEKIKDVSQPLLWFHGVEDTYVSIDNGEIIYANHGGAVKYAERVENSDHSEVPIVYGLTNYLNRLLTFIRE